MDSSGLQIMPALSNTLYCLDFSVRLVSWVPLTRQLSQHLLPEKTIMLMAYGACFGEQYLTKAKQRQQETGLWFTSNKQMVIVMNSPSSLPRAGERKGLMLLKKIFRSDPSKDFLSGLLKMLMGSLGSRLSLSLSLRRGILKLLLLSPLLLLLPLSGKYWIANKISKVIPSIRSFI